MKHLHRKHTYTHIQSIHKHIYIRIILLSHAYRLSFLMVACTIHTILHTNRVYIYINHRFARLNRSSSCVRIICRPKKKEQNLRERFEFQESLFSWDLLSFPLEKATWVLSLSSKVIEIKFLSYSYISQQKKKNLNAPATMNFMNHNDISNLLHSNV